MSTAKAKHLLDSIGTEAAVETNQRALIEKILARYSGEFTVFRELLQNADDATASNVEVHFRSRGYTDEDPIVHSAASLPNLKSHKIASMLVRNDGFVFREEDWMRLKTIAAGNPSEERIGAFGVGFYSLFSLCDEPVVVSGDKLMGFFWKGDKLYVKTANNATVGTLSAEGKPWTSFMMDLRQEVVIPDPNEFTRFLATALGFTSHIHTISLFFDSHLLCRVTKLSTTSPFGRNSTLPKISPLKILTINTMSETRLQIKADVAKYISFQSVPKPKIIETIVSASNFASRLLSAFGSSSSSTSTSKSPASDLSTVPLSDPFEMTTAILFLRIVSSHLTVSPSSHFERELERATKKKPPKKTVVSIIYSSKEETEASEGDQGAGAIFTNIAPSLSKSGRIFIGFSTQQTTGISSAISARFISTVERESLDFMSPCCADWNRELLYMAGITLRTVYESEMSALSLEWKAKGGTLDVATRLALEARASHLTKFFTFTASTPSPKVSATTDAAFYSTRQITVMSTAGPLKNDAVRLPNISLDLFYQGPTLLEPTSQFALSIKSRDLVQEISLNDIVDDLGTHTLDNEAAIACFKFWSTLASDRAYGASLLARMKQAVMLSISKEGEEERIAPLAMFRTYLNPKVIPIDSPLPDHTLPYQLTRRLPSNDLQRIFQYEELSLMRWVEYIVSPALVGHGRDASTNIMLSAQFSEKVLGIITRSPMNSQVVELLKSKPIVPTREGLKVAAECYLIESKAALFEDLPFVVMPSGSNVKQGPLLELLLTMGVRRHVELQLVFTRLLAGGKWSHVDLTQYLVSVAATLTSAEIERLKKTAWLLRANDPAEDGSSRRYSASQLYEPTESMRALGLDLLDWTSPATSKSAIKWRPHSEDAKFLYSLGLQRSPSIDVLLSIASNSSKYRTKAYEYFLAEYATYSGVYDPVKHAEYKFIPSILLGKQSLASPNEVYLEGAIMNFPTFVGNALDASKLKLPQHPPVALLVARLIAAPPSDLVEARGVFAYLSTQVTRFTSTQLSTLSSSLIIPVKNVNGSMFFSTPATTFFSSSDSSLPLSVRALFTTLSPLIDSSARPFLTAVGVKDSPSISEVTSMMLADPPAILKTVGSFELYLSLLRMVAANYSHINTTLRSRMKLAVFFVGTKREESNKAGGDDEDEEGKYTFELARASELVIVDDSVAHLIFPSILACPQESALEAIAESLGAKRLSKLVREDYRVIGEPGESSRSRELKKTIIERSYLFMSQIDRKALRHNLDWLNGRIEVGEVRSIELVRTLTLNGTTSRKSNVATCYAKPTSTGVMLYVSGDIDWYELASSLSAILLVDSRRNTNDQLIYMNILITSLKNLQRRGVNVDRILTVRRLEREAIEQERERQARVEVERRNNDSKVVGDSTASSQNSSASQFTPPIARAPLPPTSSQPDSMQQERIASQQVPQPTPSDPILPPARSTSSFLDSFKRKSSSTKAMTTSRGPTASAGITSTADIRRNVKEALQQCRSDTSSSLKSNATKAELKEPASAYCDSTTAMNLVHVKDVDGLRVFAAKDFTARERYLQENHDALARFVKIIKLVGVGVYGLPQNTLHIFYDLEPSPTIAFNKGGALFFNLRFFQSWHDAQIVAGQSQECLISTFHTMAHEIAHNLVGPHNSEHEYYFSSLCETHFVQMSQLLARSG